MALEWDYNTGTFKEVPDEEPAPPPTTTPTPAPSPAPKPKEDGWGGGFFSDLKHVVSRVPEEAAQIGRSLTQLPGALATEVSDAASFLTGGASDKVLGALEKLPQPSLPDALGGKTVEERQESAGPKDITEVTPSNVLQAPIVRLLPGAFVGDKLANDPGAILEHPVTSALDVLPLVGKAGKVATKGSGFAEEAAERAAQIGRIAKADRIATEGMKLPEIAQHAMRKAEERIVQRYPNLTGRTPSAMIESAGLGGERLRQTLQTVGTRSRAYTKDVIEEQQRILAGASEWEKAGIDSPSQSRLLSEAEVADAAWWAARSDAERGFLNWFSEQSDRMYRAYDKTFEFGGEKYTQAQSPALFKHVNRLNSIQKWKEGMERRLDPSHPKHPKSPEALENLRKRSELMDVRMAKRTEMAQETAKKAYPARFSRVINEEMRPKVQEAIEASRRAAEAEGISFPLADDVVRNLLDSGSYRQLERAGVIGKKELDNIARQTAETWQELRDKGLDPMYHHHVIRPRRERLAGPRFDPVRLLKDPSAIKKRGWDMEPWVPDAAVSLLDQAVDLIQSKHAAAWLEDMERTGMLKTSQEVTKEISQAAQRIVREMPVEKQAKVIGEVMDDLQKRLYDSFQPGGLFPFRSAKLTGTTDLFIPKGVAGVIENIAKPPKMPSVTRLPMKVFRTSVLYLNPSYYIGNSIGNAMMLSARGSPMDLRFLPKAAQAWKRGELPIEISMGSVLGTADESFRAGLSKMGWEVMDDLDSTIWSKTADRAAKAEHFLQRFAGALDDMTKATAYFAEYHKALKKGASGDLAIARAVEHMNKVNMGFDTLLPYERAVMRGVLMPFYSWSKFALGYILSYPFDHPWRASVLSKMSEQIREEWDERLPERLMGYWAVGEKNGKTKLYPAGGVYPFLSFFNTNDIWTGVLRRMSPILQVAQEYSGIDPFSGAPDPYVSWDKEKWRADPVTGRPGFVRPGIGQLLAENFLPHSEILYNSVDPEQQEYYRKNPGRYFEDLMRSLGITVPITRDLSEEAAKYAKTQKALTPKEQKPVQATPAKPAKPKPAELVWDFESGSFKEAK